MYHMLTNHLPADVADIILEKVKELHETDNRKSILKKLAIDAERHMTRITRHAMEVAMEDISDDLHWNGTADVHEEATDKWNWFIYDFQHLSHLLTGSQADSFKYREPHRQDSRRWLPNARLAPGIWT